MRSRRDWMLTGWLLLAGLMVPQSAWAQRNLKDIPDPDPEKERQTFVLPEGFEVNLYASDPAIAKPIQMNFDPQGRLWVVSSEIYPHIKPGEKPIDKVVVLEDQDHDGVAEKSTVFAEGLLIPTGVAPGNGGAYVANSTELLFLRDTDGDGKADEKQILLSGFGTEDTHHILHTFRWGPAGNLFMSQSIYIHSHVETPWGVKRLNGGGTWKLDPSNLQMEIVLRGLINQWGHAFDRWGQQFATDGAGGEGINYVVRGAAYPTAVGVPRILHGLNPGSPKYCGLEVVSGRQLPESWQGNLITADFRGHRVCRFVVEESGSGYIANQQQELIRSNHPAFRPVDIKMGPDGAIYIADWYNPIIQHGEVDFRDPRRDHTHGRIWRITYKPNKVLQRPNLVEAETAHLLGSLKSPEGWTRDAARQVLRERGRKILPELAAWVNELDANDPHLLHHQLEAVWLFQALKEPNRKLLGSLLTAPDHHVRAAATRIIPEWQGDQKWVNRMPMLAMLDRLVRDEHPQVRLEAVRALALVPSPESMEIAMQALEYPMDEFLDYALWLTARDLQDQWLPELQAGKLLFDGNLNKLTFALNAVGSPAVVQPLMNLLQSGQVQPEQQGEVIQLIAGLGQPEELQSLLTLALKQETTPELQISLLNALSHATRSRSLKPAGDLTRLRPFLSASQPELLQAALRCVGLWKVEPLREPVMQILRSTETSEPVQIAAINALADLGGPQTAEVLQQILDNNPSPKLQAVAVSAWVRVNPTQAAKQAVQLLGTLQDEQLVTEVFAAFLARKQGADDLMKALEGASLPEDVAKIGLRTLDGTGIQNELLTNTLRSAGNIATGPKMLTEEELQQLVREVQTSGDPVRGEEIFRRESLACMSCHAIGGAGGQVGPDLVSIGSSAQVDYLIESLLQPSAKIKENYQTLIVATLAGDVITGIKLRQTDLDLILRDAKDREIRIPLENIDDQATGASMMPAGLTEKLTRRELIDLVRFLSELGKVGGHYVVGQTPLVRRWQVMAPTEEAAFRLRRTSYDQAAGNDSAFLWDSVYSTVAGSLPLDSLPLVPVRQNSTGEVQGAAFVRFEIEILQPGPIQLDFQDISGLTLWTNTTPVTIQPVTEFNLPAGKHRFTLAVDLAARKSPLRVELQTPADSPAQARIVSGK